MNFSVIVPCYNCVKTLENTVNSIRASGLSNYELLLIDDGSTDGTGALCDVLCFYALSLFLFCKKARNRKHKKCGFDCAESTNNITEENSLTVLL